MVSENEHSLNNELHTTETLRHRTTSLTWISEIRNNYRKDPNQKTKLRTFRKFKLTHHYEITSQTQQAAIIE